MNTGIEREFFIQPGLPGYVRLNQAAVNMKVIEYIPAIVPVPVYAV
jgi:hypothetical protein